MSQESKIIRAFIALELPPEILQYLSGLMKDLSKHIKNVKWAKPDGIHLTLKFLGDVSPEMIEDIKKALASALAKAPSCELTTSDLGVFPSANNARVLWVGADDIGGKTAKLHKKIDAAIAPLGFETEIRAFTPHLTLARFKVPAKISINALGVETKNIPFKPTEVVLYKSVLKPSGAVYSKLHVFNL